MLIIARSIQSAILIEQRKHRNHHRTKRPANPLISRQHHLNRPDQRIPETRHRLRQPKIHLSKHERQLLLFIETTRNRTTDESLANRLNKPPLTTAS